MCEACPANSIAPKGSDELTDCMCDAGYTGSDGGTCTACIAGKYKISSGDESADCEDCACGKYSTVPAATAMDTCVDCVAGK